MAAGEFAEPIYKLIEECGGRGADMGEPHSFVLTELIAYLSGDSIRDFVEYFRQNYEMHEEDDEEDDDTGFEDYHLCPDCQESYDIDKPHACSDNEAAQKVIFFSSLIPEC